MYNVIATLKNKERQVCQYIWIAKTYKSKARAQEFVASKQYDPKYDFKIEKIKKDCSPIN